MVCVSIGSLTHTIIQKDPSRQFGYTFGWFLGLGYDMKPRGGQGFVSLIVTKRIGITIAFMFTITLNLATAE